MKAFILILGLMTTAGGCAQQLTGDTADKAISPGERLLATVPPGWHRIYSLNGESTRLADYVKEGETSAAWSTKLSFESFNAADIEADPVTLLTTEAQGDMSRCNFVQHFNIFSGYENNYETSVRLFLCGENAFAGKGEVKIVKLIRGEENYYAVRIVKRIPPFDVSQPGFSDNQVANWSEFISSISLCDDSANHPCPAASQE
jgi:hypothetical protein